ncbi:MAG: hypothetical protein KH054_09030 [Firmicutes bacterium]|nr:hypothetical protein [Bacillota bacterium]
MKLKLQEIEFIKKNIPDGDKLLEEKDWSEIESRLDEYELVYGYIDNNFDKGINDNGRFAERLIDKIYYDEGNDDILEIEDE